MATPEELFARLAADHLRDPDVTAGTGFGAAPGLRIHGRIFAMVVRGELAVKLPPPRIEEILRAGTGRRFDAGRGRPMREWAVVPPAEAARWPDLVAEARQYVGDAGTGPPAGSRPPHR